MKKRKHCYTCESTRRSFIKTAALGSVAVALPAFSGFDQLEAAAFNKAIDENNMTDVEKLHIPKVTLPPVVEDGNQAPIIVESDHPMEEDHYIKSIQKENISSKVSFHVDQTMDQQKEHIYRVELL